MKRIPFVINIFCLLIIINYGFSFIVRPSEKPQEASTIKIDDKPIADADLEASYAVPRPVRIGANNNQEEKFKPADPYNYGFDIKDDFGNRHFRQEHSDGQGTIRGSYGYTDALGLYRIVEYVADADGFRASVKTNEPGLNNESPANVAMNAQEPPQEVTYASLRETIQNTPKLISSSSSSSYSIQGPQKSNFDFDQSKNNNITTQ